MNIAEKLYTVRFNPDKRKSHILVDNSKCEKCLDKVCLHVCPAQVYTLEEGEVIASYQGCLECGTCRIACSEGAIQWEFPKGGYGVCFRFG